MCPALFPFVHQIMQEGIDTFRLLPDGVYFIVPGHSLFEVDEVVHIPFGRESVSLEAADHLVPLPYEIGLLVQRSIFQLVEGVEQRPADKPYGKGGVGFTGLDGNVFPGIELDGVTGYKRIAEITAQLCLYFVCSIG